MADNKSGMNRRHVLQLLGGGLTAAAVPVLSSSCTKSDLTGKRPNFVIVLCDDLGYGDLACYGHPVIQTPNLDRFAEEGMKFTDCYTAAPVCSPARTGMLTGRTPNRCGIYTYLPEGSTAHMKPSEITIASLLRAAGYQTCHVGKWHCNGKFNSPEQPQPDDHGFDHWFSTQNNARPNHLNPQNFARNGEYTGTLEGYSSTLIADEAIAWLDQIESDKPFCLFVWFHAPHVPIATGESFTGMYPDTGIREKSIYYGNVTQMDYEFGRLMQTLDRKNLRDDTFVFYTSDNGPEK